MINVELSMTMSILFGFVFGMLRTISHSDRLKKSGKNVYMEYFKVFVVNSISGFLMLLGVFIVAYYAANFLYNMF